MGIRTNNAVPRSAVSLQTLRAPLESLASHCLATCVWARRKLAASLVCTHIYTSLATTPTHPLGQLIAPSHLMASARGHTPLGNRQSRGQDTLCLGILDDSSNHGRIKGARITRREGAGCGHPKRTQAA